MGALLVALYARTVAPGPTFSDGPEIVTGIVTLGVIHPTGYPLFTLVAHAFVKLLPLHVQPCVKVSLFNALCAGAAAIFTAHSARAMALVVKPGPDGERVGRTGADFAGLFAGVLLGTSPLVWDQVRIPEVYPFHLFLAAWALFGLFRFEATRKPWYLVMSGLAIGLGLAHHVTMVYMLPAAIVYSLVRQPGLLYGPFVWPVAKIGRLFKKDFLSRADIGRAWVFPVVLVVGFLPAFFYAYLLWANKHTTGLNWGGVNDWNGLYFHMTGKQYTKFMVTKDISAYLTRISRLPDAFDKQFLTVGTVLVFPGVIAAFRRAWRPALLLFLVFLFFVGHGIYYSVGDYQTYFLPAVMALSVLIAVGLDWLLRWAAERPPEKRLFTTLWAGAGVLAATSLTILYYSNAQKRFPAPLVKYATPGFVVPLGVLALVLGVAASVFSKRARRAAFTPRGKKVKWFPKWPVGARVLPGILLASALVPLVPAIGMRVSDIDERQVVGDSYGREVMENAPRGSVVAVQGDGYLFTLWYQTHVMGRGTDAAIIDVGSLGAQWYKKYLINHYPAGCDPLAPEFLLDRAAYDARCKTFRQRIDLGATTGWITMGERRNKGISAGEKARGLAILKEWIDRSSGRVPRAPRTDVRCDEAEFRRGHTKECRCWYDAKKEPTYSEDCVFSAEEEGIVPRERVEIWLHHLIEEHIDERPVFERNLFTHWKGDAKDNPRGWSGPDYQRPSGEFAMVNRGRANQILYATEVSSPAAAACGPTRKPLDVQRKGAGKGGPKEGRPYRPNEWPTLVTSSYLTRGAGLDDSATRSFTAGDEVRLTVDWFEKNRYDFFAAGKKGTPVKHGIRICIFDGSGKKVAGKSTVSGRKDAAVFKLPADAPGGDYHIAACTVGEIGDNAKLAEEGECRRLILEYPFKVAARKK